MPKYTIKSGDTLSQIAKKNNISLKALLGANPSIKNANKIRSGQSIKLPYKAQLTGSGTKNPYKGLSQTQMNMLNVKNKNKKAQQNVTRGVQTAVKHGSQTSPIIKKEKKVKDKKDTTLLAMNKAKQKLKNKKKPTNKLKTLFAKASNLLSGSAVAKPLPKPKLKKSNVKKPLPKPKLKKKSSSNTSALMKKFNEMVKKKKTVKR